MGMTIAIGQPHFQLLLGNGKFLPPTMVVFLLLSVDLESQDSLQILSCTLSI